MTDDLRTIRTRMGYSQSQAGEAVGKTKWWIGRIEQTGRDPGQVAAALRRHEQLVEAGIEERIPERPPAGWKKGRPRKPQAA